jgi:hypothetical protein
MKGEICLYQSILSMRCSTWRGCRPGRCRAGTCPSLSISRLEFGVVYTTILLINSIDKISLQNSQFTMERCCFKQHFCCRNKQNFCGKKLEKLLSKGDSRCFKMKMFTRQEGDGQRKQMRRGWCLPDRIDWKPSSPDYPDRPGCDRTAPGSNRSRRPSDCTTSPTSSIPGTG